MTIQLDMYQTIAVAVVVLMLGNFLKHRIAILERFCIPAPVIGCVIFAIFTCVCYVTVFAEITLYDIIKEEFNQKKIDIDKIKNTKIVPYIYNMSEIMNTVDIIVARSGAMTITELALVGKPAIFIPLPSMSANRQLDNAKVLENLGAAKIILNEEVNSENLSKTIDEMLENPEKLKEMGNQARKIAKYNVEEKIYEEIKKIVK